MALKGSADLPVSAWQAMARGIRFHCPRCGEGHLFDRFLKPVPTCATCDQDWTLQRADDFPAYVAIFVTGHLLAPLMILLGRDTELSVTAMLAILLPLAVVMMVGMLQPAKGAIIAVQWWFGLHGFVKERRAEVEQA